MRCYRCGYTACECSKCAACEEWVWSETLTRNPDGDRTCPTCTASGRRSADAIDADHDNDLTDTAPEEATAA